MKLLVLFCLFARAASLAQLTANITLGESVVLSGEQVQMSCWTRLLQQTDNYTWYYEDRSTGLRKWAGSSWVLTLRNLTPEGSGNYTCATNVNNSWVQSDAVQLIVVQRISSLHVEANPPDPFVFKGSHVLLRCKATSSPSSVTWSWYRQGPQGPERVGSGLELTVEGVENSGDYYCQAESATLGINQTKTSQSCQVHILIEPVGIFLNQAAFILSLLAWVLLLMIVTYLWMQRAKKEEANPVSVKAQAEGLSGPANKPNAEKKGKGSENNEVYMNCKETGKFYSDLDRAYITDDNVYDNLS